MFQILRLAATVVPLSPISNLTGLFQFGGQPHPPSQVVVFAATRLT